LSNIEEREHQSLLVYRERMRIEPRGFLRTKSTIGRPNGGIVGARPAAALRRFPASQGFGWDDAERNPEWLRFYCARSIRITDATFIAAIRTRPAPTKEKWDCSYDRASDCGLWRL
jgi:hypothetical protein